MVVRASGRNHPPLSQGPWTVIDAPDCQPRSSPARFRWPGGYPSTRRVGHLHPTPTPVGPVLGTYSQHDQWEADGTRATPADGLPRERHELDWEFDVFGHRHHLHAGEDTIFVTIQWTWGGDKASAVTNVASRRPGTQWFQMQPVRGGSRSPIPVAGRSMLADPAPNLNCLTRQHPRRRFIWGRRHPPPWVKVTGGRGGPARRSSSAASARLGAWMPYVDEEPCPAWSTNTGQWGSRSTVPGRDSR